MLSSVKSIFLLSVILFISCEKKTENISFGDYEIIVGDDVNVISSNFPITFIASGERLSFIILDYGMNFFDYKRNLDTLGVKYQIYDFYILNERYKAISEIEVGNGVGEVVSYKLFVKDEFIIAIDALNFENGENVKSNIQMFLKSHFIHR